MAKKPKKNVVVMDDTQVSFEGKAKVMDVVTGNDLDNQINGRGGDDKLKGMGGNDTLIGGRGNDKLDGGEGDDNVSGGAGDDIITANAGTDTIDGGDGDDTLKIAVNYADATVNTDGESFTITTALGTVTVKNVEFFQFNDKTVTADNLIPPSSDIILTEKADNVTGAAIFAPRGFTPGGTDQVNTLNDDDIINGTGDNATLTVDFVNDADTGDNNIQPTMKNIANIITNVRTDGDATIDLQDSEGTDDAANPGEKVFKNLEVRGVDDFASFTYDNIQNRAEQLTIRDSQADNGFVNFLFDGDAIDGTNDSTKLVLDNAQVLEVFIGPENGAPGVGIEHLAISVEDDSRIGTLTVEDAEDITVTGESDLMLGTEDPFTFNDRVEAMVYGAGLASVAGSLTKFDASALTGNLVINLGSEVQGPLDDTSGDPVEFKAIGGAGDDIFRLLAKFDSAGDSVDGGAGSNTLVVFDTVDSGTATNIQHLEVRNQEDTTGGPAASMITIDTSLIGGLTDILVRNEAIFNGAPFAHTSTVVLNKLTAAQATAITVLHSTTGSNGLDDNIVTANLATDTANDTVGLTIDDGVNSDPRFNLQLVTAGVENVTLTDTDGESSTVLLGADGVTAIDKNGGSNVSDITGTITLVGGKEGTYLSLDVGDFGGAAGGEGIYGLDVTGGTAQDEGGTKDKTTGSGANTLDNFGGAADVRITAAKIDATGYIGDVIVRVSDAANSAGVFTATGGQTILMGSGNDTVIFDQDSAGGSQTTAGLTISDIVDGGGGDDDTIVVDGNGFRITLGASEWTNVKNFENIRLVGNAQGDNNAVGAVNAYNIVLTNDMLVNNGVVADGGKRINIINDNDLTDGLNNAGTGFGFANTGVTIDARTLNSTNSFSYNGAEGPTMTADRFIMSDANINARAIIDGGAAFAAGYAATQLGNLDVLEVRNGAVVTTGDLSGIKNVSNIEFTNDLAAVQNSTLQLTTGTIDALVNSEHTSSAGQREVLNVTATGNALVPGATHTVNIDGSGLDLTVVGLTLNTGVGGFFTLTNVNGPVTFNGGAGDDIFVGTAANDTINGGGGADTLTGGDGNDVMTGGAGNDIINAGNGDDDITGGAGNDTMTGGAGADDFFFAGGSGGLTPIAADHITDFQFNVDKIQSVFDQSFGDVYQEADGTALTFLNIVNNANALFTGGLANVYVAFNAVSSGNAYVLIDQNLSGTYDVGDTFVILDGIDQAFEISSTDFA